MTEGSQQMVVRVLEYWRLGTRYKWPIMIGTLALTLVATVIIGRLPNVYEATTTILVDPQQVSEKYIAPTVTMDTSTRLNTITQQVLSRTRLQEIMDKFNLYADRRRLTPPEELVEQMRDDIKIQVKQGSGPELSTFTITYQGRNPVLVANVANELATSFIRWNVKSREEEVSGTREFLNSELADAKKNLEQQENMLRQFKMSHLGETPDQTANNLQILANLRSSLQANSDAINRLEEEKILLTRLPEQTTTRIDPNTVVLTERSRLELEKRQLETTIQQLREHYSDRYPDVANAVHRLGEINVQLKSMAPDSAGQDASHDSEPPVEASATSVRLELIDKEMKRLKGEQNRIQSQTEVYQSRVDASPLREQQLVELTRNYDISKQHYQSLLEKTMGADMAEDLEQKQKAERFRVLDPAQVPVKPVKPRRKMLIPLSGLFALGLSLTLAAAKGMISPAIKTEMELKSLMPKGVRIIGLIPGIEITADGRRRRRVAIAASFACILLCLALAAVILRMRPLL